MKLLLRCLSLFLLLVAALPAAAEIRTLKTATGELLVHPFEGGIPLPAESRWTIAQGAGPAFVPEGGGHRLTWHLILDPRTGERLAGVTRATLQEVSGKTAQALFDGAPGPTAQGGLIVSARGEVVSREAYPWLYAPDATLVLLRVVLHRAGQHDKLVQPVLIGADVKKKLRDGGYLP